MLTRYLDLMIIAAVSASKIDDLCLFSNSILTVFILGFYCSHNYRYVPEWLTFNYTLTNLKKLSTMGLVAIYKW